MKHFSHFRWFVLLAALLAAFVLVPAAYALTITVDGAISDWGATAPVATDLNESGIPDTWDISAVYQTSDSTFLYWRTDTFGNPTNWNPGYPYPYMFICMNTDNNVGTGATISQCAGMTGVDHILRLDGDGTSTPTTTLLGCAPGCSPVGAAVTNAAFANQYTEARVNLAAMNITPGGCSGTRTIVAAVYFDNSDTPPDDNIPDTGTFSFNLPCPTAVGLAQVSARASSSNLVKVKWQTGTELNIIGFNVLRRGGGMKAWKQLNGDIIDAKNVGQITGSRYVYDDSAVEPGKTYRYKLQIVYTDGSKQSTKGIKVKTPK